MKRTLELDINKAIEYFYKGGELRDIALSVYTEKEILEAMKFSFLPKSWEEFCRINRKVEEEWLITANSQIYWLEEDSRDPELNANLLATKSDAETHLALIQLHRLRDCYRRGWKPDWEEPNQPKYTITFYGNTPMVDTTFQKRAFLSFQSEKIATEFLENFRDLILKLRDL